MVKVEGSFLFLSSLDLYLSKPTVLSGGCLHHMRCEKILLLNRQTSLRISNLLYISATKLKGYVCCTGNGISLKKSPLRKTLSYISTKSIRSFDNLFFIFDVSLLLVTGELLQKTVYVTSVTYKLYNIKI